MKFDVKGLEKLSLVEWSGKMTAIIFTGGCNFACPFCHNPELIKNLSKIPSFPWEEIEKFLKKKKGWIDTIMITGGEPTLQPDLPKACKIIKKHGYLVGIATNGTNPDMIEKLSKEKLVDRICMDVKNSEEKYEKTVGNMEVNMEKIKKSIENIKRGGIFYEFRTTVVPGLIEEKDIEKIGKLVKGAELFSIQQFRPIKTLDKKYEKITPYSKERLLKMGKILEKYVNKVNLDFVD